MYQEPLAELKKDIGEIWVEETIEDGVCAAGGDSDQVADEVSQHHGLYNSVQNSATFPVLLLKSSKKVVFLNKISSK